MQLVLVHGAWHDENVWNWVDFPDDVDVVAPRLNYEDPDVTLLDHAMQILDTVGDEECVIVAHSYAGFPTTLAQQLLAAMNGQKGCPVVYVDAAIPLSENATLYSGVLPPLMIDAMRVLPKVKPMIAAGELIDIGSFVGYDNKLTSWLQDNLRPFPRRLFTETYPLSQLQLPRKALYLQCKIPIQIKGPLKESNTDIYVTAALIEQQGYPVYECQEPHNVMMTNPAFFADAVMEWVEETV
jgi:pimeloyl-ACP methyl ester carboxylesterase